MDGAPSTAARVSPSSPRGSTAGRGRGLAVAVALIAAAGGRLAADRVADAVADEAALAAVQLGESLAQEPEPDAAPSLDAIVGLGDAAAVELRRGLVVERVAMTSAPPAVTGGAGPRSRGAAASPAAPTGILIRAAVVKAAVARGGVPSGTPIAAEGPRPAGLVLHGVSGYGTALRDGDVLVRVGGTPATSESRVIGAVSGALRSGARAIDGEVWRGARRIPVVVELPRIRVRSPRRKG